MPSPPSAQCARRMRCAPVHALLCATSVTWRKLAAPPSLVPKLRLLPRQHLLHACVARAALTQQLRLVLAAAPVHLHRVDRLAANAERAGHTHLVAAAAARQRIHLHQAARQWLGPLKPHRHATLHRLRARGLLAGAQVAPHERHGGVKLGGLSDAEEGHDRHKVDGQPVRSVPDVQALDQARGHALQAAQSQQVEHGLVGLCIGRRRVLLPHACEVHRLAACSALLLPKHSIPARHAATTHAAPGISAERRGARSWCSPGAGTYTAVACSG
mmetsp:Transcript_32154/g.81721  ORF Transcript_32154/g.81721 Transcript_32154/m.81721 type:complete len:272 (+) Transcript_32154:246-1061(+)